MIAILRLSLITLTGLVALNLSAADVGAKATAQDLATHLADAIKTHDLPGITALALRGNEVIMEACAGVRKRGDSAKVTLDDAFHLGSDTKAMTATLVGLAVEEGKLKWTTTLEEALGDGPTPMLAAWKAVTVQQLLSHRSGLPRDTTYQQTEQGRRAPLPIQRRDIARDAFTHAPDSTAGTRFVYSNLGFIITGSILEKAADRAWEDLMRDRLFQPLGITTAGFGGPPSAWGHWANGKPVDPTTPEADNAAYMGPAGTVHMTMRDWAKFVGLHLRGDPANPNHATKLLKSETFQHLHTAESGGNYSGGWGVTTRPWAKGNRLGDTGRVLQHAGSNRKWYCITWVAPEIDFAVLIATNQGGDKAAKACDQIAGEMIAILARPQR